MVRETPTVLKDGVSTVRNGPFGHKGSDFVLRAFIRVWTFFGLGEKGEGTELL